MDRLAGIFMESHPGNQYTSNFPLQPFMDNGTKVSYDDPRRWKYTTIGDMAKDTRALGYMYAPPLSKDVFTPPVGFSAPKASGGCAISLLVKQPQAVNVSANRTASPAKKKVPYVVFSGVGCTDSSYRIDVFTPQAKSFAVDVVGNPDFIGHITRLGMGRGAANSGRRSTRRCRQPEASRVLSAERVGDELRQGDSENDNVQIIVTNLETGKTVTAEDYMKLPGFEPKVVWLDTQN